MYERYKKSELYELTAELERSYRELGSRLYRTLGNEWCDGVGTELRQNIVSAAESIKEDQLSHSVLYCESPFEPHLDGVFTLLEECEHVIEVI